MWLEVVSAQLPQVGNLAAAADVPRISAVGRSHRARGGRCRAGGGRCRAGGAAIPKLTDAAQQQIFERRTPNAFHH